MIVAGIIIAIVIVLISWISYEMFNVCCARTPSPLIKLIIKGSMAAEVGFGEDSKRGTELWNNSDIEEICIKSHDGLSLYGYYRRHKNAKRAILMVHGYRMQGLPTFAAVLPEYDKNDCDMMIIDHRGAGKSTGKYITFGITEHEDVARWVKVLCEKQPDIPVYLDGISMGASTVLALSNFDLPKNFAGIIADSGYTTPKEIIRHVISSYIPGPSAPLLGLISMMFRLIIKRRLSDLDCRECLRNSKYPILFIHGKKDRFVPYTMCEENFAACISPKKMFYSENAEHGMSFMEDRDALVKMITEFFAENDSLTEV